MNSICSHRKSHLSLGTARLIEQDALHRHVRVQPLVQCFMSQFQNIDQKTFKIKML